MFPLQRGNELVIQFSNSPYQHQHQQEQEISEDLILMDDCASLDVNDSHHHKLLFTNSIHSKNHLFYAAAHDDGNNSSPIVDHKKKKNKMAHREIEKQRRQEMASLYSSLRSLLPLDFIKGKRSISEHMNEAVNYIKQMQKNIKELGAKRDELKKLITISNLEKNHDDDENNNNNNSPTSNNCSFITVHENNNNNNNNCVVGIEINSGIIREKEGLIVSKLMQLLLQEGLEVVSYISTKVNGRLVHSVHCEGVNNSSSVDLSELRRKIANLIPTSFGCSD